MESFRIATVQMNALKDDLSHNIEVHREFVDQAVSEGCRLVMFPELSVTAHYGDLEVRKFAEEAGKGPVYREIGVMARNKEIFIGYGFAEKANGTFYNTYAVVGPEGIVALQRKVVASGDEYFCFRMGRSLEVFDLGFCRVGILICYDRSFSEHWRVMALQGAEVILQPSAGRSGGAGREVPREEQRARLAEKLDAMPGELGTYEPVGIPAGTVGKVWVLMRSGC